MTGSAIIGPVGCASACGGCCDPVVLSNDQRERFEAQAAHPDLEQHPEAFNNLLFVAEHWQETDRDEHQTYYRCDAYDQLTRRCTAHANRPAICRGFPFYGHPPNSDQLGMLPRCSYWWNLPRSERMDGVRPFIPITDVTARKI